MVYATGLTTKIKHPDGAKELVSYLWLPSAVPVIQKNGMSCTDDPRGSAVGASASLDPQWRRIGAPQRTGDAP
jgi:hypothetical protein